MGSVRRTASPVVGQGATLTPSTIEDSTGHVITPAQGQQSSAMASVLRTASHVVGQGATLTQITTEDSTGNVVISA